jgi:hypothetical protein
MQTSPDGAAATLTVSKENLVATAGPITITFGYTIDGISGGGGEAQLTLSARQTREESARIKVEDNGDLVISKNQYFEGHWKRKQ